MNDIFIFAVVICTAPPKEVAWGKIECRWKSEIRETSRSSSFFPPADWVVSIRNVCLEFVGRKLKIFLKVRWKKLKIVPRVRRELTEGNVWNFPMKWSESAEKWLGFCKNLDSGQRITEIRRDWVSLQYPARVSVFRTHSARMQLNENTWSVFIVVVVAVVVVVVCVRPLALESVFVCFIMLCDCCFFFGQCQLHCEINNTIDVHEQTNERMNRVKREKPTRKIRVDICTARLDECHDKWKANHWYW